MTGPRINFNCIFCFDIMPCVSLLELYFLDEIKILEHSVLTVQEFREKLNLLAG